MKYKYLSLLFTAIVLWLNVFSQPFLKAQRTGGGNLYDYFTCMGLTKDGGLIAGGYSPSNMSGEKTENSRGGDDYWVVKLDSAGLIEWDKTIGGSEFDRLYSIQQTSDGGYILGGYSPSNISGEKTENNKGGGDYWIVRLDMFGQIKWDRTIGGTSSDVLNSLQQTSDGGYILGGTSFSNISGDKSQRSRGGNDYWIVKLDSFGNIEWDKTIGGNGDDNLNSVSQTTDGGYILGGYSQSGISGEKTEPLTGIYDYWVVKINSSGKVEWDNALGALYSYNFLNCLQQTNDGGYILGGRSSANISGDKTENSRGGWDYWIIKLNSAGVKQWDKTIGGTGNENLSSVQQTRDGGYVLAGNSTSNISGEKTENSKGGEDYWIVKLDSLHNIQWDKTIGGDSYDVPKSIVEVEKDKYTVGGYSISGKSGDKNKGSRGGVDYWVVALVNKRNEEIGNPSHMELVTSKQTFHPPYSDIKNEGIKLVIPTLLQRNQIWNIQGLPASNTITLIDNKGQTVFKAINYKNNTGFNHLAVGLYYYQIMLKDKDGKPELYRGKLMIIP